MIKYPYQWQFRLLTALLAIAPLSAVHAESFQLDFDSVQTGVQEQRGADWIFEGGFSPLQEAGTASVFQDQPIGVVAYCGNGVKESDEQCDGTDLGGADCEWVGLAEGVLRCTTSCTLSTAECLTEDQVSRGGGGGAGRGGDGDRSPQEALAPVVPPEAPLPPPQPLADATESPKHMEALQSAVSETSTTVASTTSTRSPADTLQHVPSPSSEDREAPPYLQKTYSNVPEAKESLPLESSPIANAVALGGISLTEAGILGRLAWMARLKNLYGVIPAFLS